MATDVTFCTYYFQLWFDECLDEINSTEISAAFQEVTTYEKYNIAVYFNTTKEDHLPRVYETEYGSYTMGEKQEPNTVIGMLKTTFHHVDTLETYCNCGWRCDFGAIRERMENFLTQITFLLKRYYRHARL